jgi:hypothetical protein
MPLIRDYNGDSNIYGLHEEEPSVISYEQLQPKTASSYKTFGDEA